MIHAWQNPTHCQFGQHWRYFFGGALVLLSLHWGVQLHACCSGEGGRFALVSAGNAAGDNDILSLARPP